MDLIEVVELQVQGLMGQLRWLRTIEANKAKGQTIEALEAHRALVGEIKETETCWVCHQAMLLEGQTVCDECYQDWRRVSATSAASTDTLPTTESPMKVKGLDVSGLAFTTASTPPLPQSDQSGTPSGPAEVCSGSATIPGHWWWNHQREGNLSGQMLSELGDVWAWCRNCGALWSYGKILVPHVPQT